MPTLKGGSEDEFGSVDLSEVNTLMSKPKKNGKLGATKSKKTDGKQGPRRRVTSAPGERTAREMWLATVKAGPHLAGSSYKKSGKNGLSFLSTSNYLRQIAAADGMKHSTASTLSRRSARVPAYKSQEDYYDEIIELKKTLQGYNLEISHLKSKLRRTEEENLKKEKEIEQLLNPSTDKDLRRTLTDRQANSSVVIHSLKQKVHKLEIQLRDKEATYSKLQSDLKKTNIDEMKIQMGVLYSEVIRLQHLKDVSPSDTKRNIAHDKPSKVKALNETILRLNDQNHNLQQENVKIKQDLQKLMEDNSPEDTQKHENLQSLNKTELVSMIRRLNRRLNKREQATDDFPPSRASGDAPLPHMKGKIVLEGTVENRLEQLDRRETELMQEIEVLHGNITRLKDDRNSLRQQVNEKNIEIKILKKSLDGMPEGTKHPTAVSATHFAPSQKPGQARRDSRRTSMRSMKAETPRKQRDYKTALEDRQKQIEDFQKNRAARNIQKSWRRHQDKRETHMATETIHAAVVGHHARKAQLNKLEYLEGDTTDEEFGQAVNLIRSSLSGHSTRRKQLKMLQSSTDDVNDNKLYKKSPRQPRRSVSGHTSHQASSVDDDFYD